MNAGGSLTYTLVVTNSGPSADDGAVVKDPAVVNFSVTSVTCPSATGGAACPATLTVALLQASGLVIPTLPLNGAVTLNVIGTAGLTGTINNSASATPPAGTAGNDSASTSILPVADVGIAKTGPATIKAGSAITYTLTISNAGPSIADGATFMDNVPAAVSGVTASCGGATGGAFVRTGQRLRQFGERYRAGTSRRRQRRHHDHRKCRGRDCVHEHGDRVAAARNFRSESFQQLELREHERRLPSRPRFRSMRSGRWRCSSR